MVGSSAQTFGELLRRLRIAAGMTQEKLAEAAGISARSVSDLERGINQRPRNDTARLLADALALTGESRSSFETAARGEAQAWPEGRAIAAATRTLPRDTVSFIGREEELSHLAMAVASATRRPGVVSVHAIGGMAGVGKTAFAVHAAHRLAGQFPDGRIFLPLHGHTPGQPPVDPSGPGQLAADNRNRRPEESARYRAADALVAFPPRRQANAHCARRRVRA